MEYPIWYKQSGFRFNHSNKTVYIDPWQLPKSEPKADFLFLTHGHSDHFDLDTITQLQKKETIIIAPEDVAQQIDSEQLIVVTPNQTQNLEGITFETIPAYNLEKEYHPRTKSWVGYVLTFGGTRYYHAGDTDVIPEMQDVKADIAILPIGGTYTMDVTEALQAIDMIRPKIVIPMHYGFIIGSPEDGEELRRSSRVPVKILTPQISFP